ncbi:MAG: hypothetical protein F6K23_20195 [Okeania sp. SIO2C9]|uniref:nSTAND3 domain-containing NTPase n=1 Tax=Okeania sp. SIO2C9 TaxID=2607791 RepID=UPI0013BF1143|nr:hypothetical protein [Okeania sp. SIO2C9]NEQ75161.1 hypothetical protein [Okeania sp. SIO2C9]
MTSTSYYNSDATPAYRGYRLQALYTLSKILESDKSSGLIFQPEGKEDLAIFNDKRDLLEIIQVKAYTGKLTLSTFSPDKSDSFFYRVNAELKQYSELKVSVVSFGPIGREICQACETEGDKRNQVAEKLSSYGRLSKVESEKLLDCITLIPTTEDAIRETVYKLLRESLTGIDCSCAFELLNYWLYECAENKTEITREELIKKINDVGRFLAERATYHNEWFTSIVPIEDVDIQSEQQNKLSSEFYRGVSARYEHILADVDKPRFHKLKDINEKFKHNRVVIIHGASGQGKTTLAYRYLYEFFPNQWRFQVKTIDSRQQALSIARAIDGHANAIGIPLAVYIDVSPNDIGWVELVKQLSTHKNILILVTVREEDFRRASVSGVELQFSSVELKFDQTEAEDIYEWLAQTARPTQFLNFEDVWTRFGDQGPLMEFVYLVTQGSSLRERLQQQVNRIEDEVGRCEIPESTLELLRLVSIASAFESRLKIKPLIQELGLPTPRRTFEILEEEYLLRRNEDCSLVGGLHPIRSTILTELLTDPTFAPWGENASRCLPIIFENDLESFLLHSFSRRQEESGELIQKLETYQPQQWVAIAGIIRALLWLGVKEYVGANHQLIQEVYQKVGRGWIFTLDFDITNVRPGTSTSLQHSLSNFYSQEGVEYIKTVHTRQADKQTLFTRVNSWLSSQSQYPIDPESELDWFSVAEVMFWIGYTTSNSSLPNCIPDVAINSLVNNLPVAILAEMALGLFYYSEEKYKAWLKTNYSELINRFRQTTQTIVWEDDGQKIISHFLIEIDLLNSMESEEDRGFDRQIVDEITERVRLFRKLLPDRERYACYGYGHQILPGELPTGDETHKDISRENFLLERPVFLNSIFKAIVDQDFRPDTWEDYVAQIIELRNSIINNLQLLIKNLEIYFRKKRKTDSFGNKADWKNWEKCKQSLVKPPLLPRCAFDEWGFITDQKDTSKDASSNFNIKALAHQKYKSYLKVMEDYKTALLKFFSQAVEEIIAINPFLGEVDNSKIQELANAINIHHQIHISTYNLADACKKMPAFQVEFSNLFDSFSSESLQLLERQEREIITQVWNLWYFFGHHCQKHLQNATQECKQLVNKKLKELQNKLKKELKAAAVDGLSINIISEYILWKKEKFLCLTVNSNNLINTYNSLETILNAIRQAINKVESNKLREYVLEFNWPYIVVIPLVKGKLSSITAWRFSTLVFLNASDNSKLEWWNFVLKSIPKNVIGELKLESWNLPRLEVVNKMVSSFSQLLTLTSHVRDFQRLPPERDEQGSEELKSYFQKNYKPMSELLETTLNSIAEMEKYFNNLQPSEQKKRTNLTIAMQIMIKIHQNILPNSESSKAGIIEETMNLSDVIELANRINQSHRDVSLGYLYWVADVIDTNSYCDTDS